MYWVELSTTAANRLGRRLTTTGEINGAVNNNNWNRQNCALHQPLMEWTGLSIWIYRQKEYWETCRAPDDSIVFINTTTSRSLKENTENTLKIQTYIYIIKVWGNVGFFPYGNQSIWSVWIFFFKDIVNLHKCKVSGVYKL